jgi:dolichol-phosphate mannosyltransferase
MIDRLVQVRETMRAHYDVGMIFINDGSTDRTIEILSDAAQKHPNLFVIDLARNFGHQIALSAGLDFADADYISIIDGDLQDPPELVPEMLEICKRGFDVVYGQRSARAGETFFKKFTAYLFYRMINNMCRVDIPSDTGDFRLINRKVLNEFKKFKERHRFIRGMVPWLGFKSHAFQYKRDIRFAGVTKYSLRKMARFALDAVLSFSNIPLRLATYVGLIMVCLGAVLALYLLYLKLVIQSPAPGVTAILIAMLLLGGFQILMLGLIGEYIGRIFEEVKGRPLYVVNSVIGKKN